MAELVFTKSDNRKPISYNDYKRIKIKRIEVTGAKSSGFLEAIKKCSIYCGQEIEKDPHTEQVTKWFAPSLQLSNYIGFVFDKLIVDVQPKDAIIEIHKDCLKCELLITENFPEPLIKVVLDIELIK